MKAKRQTEVVLNSGKLVDGFWGHVTATWSAATAAAAISAAGADSSGPINLFIFSGGAEAFANALAQHLIDPSVVARIQNITYASPGIVGVPATVNNIIPTVITGQGTADELAMKETIIPENWRTISTGCNHDAQCEFMAALASGVSV
jgi:hypothetical protein